jgi:3'5'-cyclic nucleotide phosphodiesterase
VNALIAPPTIKKKKAVKSIWGGTGLEGVLGVTDIDDSLERLIDWNVDVLYSLLKRVMAWRVASGQASTTLGLSHERKIGASGGLVLDEIQMCIEVPKFNAEVTERAYKEDVDLVDEVKKELKEYITAIASGYRKNSFHNFEHASHVILSSNKLMKRIMQPDQVGPDQRTTITSADLYHHTYGIGTDPITQFSVVFSALIHDVGHTGVPNFLLAKEHPELAEKYINKSIAEQRSVDISWELLLLPRFKNLRSCIYQNVNECKRFRQLVVNSVMATDIFDAELKALRNSRWEKAFYSKPESPSADNSSYKATIVIEHIIQASDVSHTMQHWYIYQVSCTMCPVVMQWCSAVVCCTGECNQVYQCLCVCDLYLT